jgi:hypothetical protein
VFTVGRNRILGALGGRTRPNADMRASVCRLGSDECHNSTTVTAFRYLPRSHFIFASPSIHEHGSLPHSVGTVARELLFSDWIRLISSHAISDARLDHQEGTSLRAVSFRTCADGSSGCRRIRLAYAVIKFRERAHDDKREPPQVYGNSQVETAWTVIPVLIVLAFVFGDSPGNCERSGSCENS